MSKSVIQLNLSASRDVELCRDRCYPTKHVTNLPRPCILDDGARLNVDYCRVEELPQCRAMIKDSTTRGDNVGVDQDEDRLGILFSMSEIFAVRESRTGVATAFILIYPSLYSRTFDNSLAGIDVYTSSELASQPAVYQQLLRLAVEFTQLLDVGYTNCVVCMASSCHQKTSTLRQEGFLIVATIPQSVNIAGRGYIEDFFMVKNLAPPRPRRLKKEVLEMVETLMPTEKCNHAYLTTDLPKVALLPKIYRFANGTNAIVRNMRKEEDVEIYSMFMTEAWKGQGYGTQEYPTIAVFRRLILLKEYCIVYEDIATHEIIAFSMFGDCWYSRNPTGYYGESSTVVKANFQGIGLGKEVIALELYFLKTLGYKAMLNDALASNHRMMHLTRSYTLILGTVPHGSYTEGWGWDDQLIGLVDFSNSAYEEITKRFASSLKEVEIGENVSKL